MEQRTIQTQESAERIDALLARSLPELTRSAAQRLLAQGAVTKDGAPVKKNYKTAPGDTFVVTLPDAAPSELVAQDLPLDVVYEDDDLIVVNKRTKQAVILNLCRSFLLDSAVIFAVPAIFGGSAVWLTMGIYEGLALLLGVVLQRASERNGIVFR